MLFSNNSVYGKHFVSVSKFGINFGASGVKVILFEQTFSKMTLFLIYFIWVNLKAILFVKLKQMLTKCIFVSKKLRGKKSSWALEKTI